MKAIANVHIFFNNRESYIPPGGEWGKFQHADSMRLALFAAESWKRNGWTPKFYNTRETVGFAEGELKRLRNDYPTEFLNCWFEMRKLAPAWFSTTDVYNRAFRPSDAIEAMESAGFPEAISVQKVTFATACMWVTPTFCDQVIALIRSYEKGSLSLPPIELVSDEHIIRHHGSFKTVPVMAFAGAEAGWEFAPLIHFARSCLQWFKM